MTIQGHFVSRKIILVFLNRLLRTLMDLSIACWIHREKEVKDFEKSKTSILFLYLISVRPVTPLSQLIFAVIFVVMLNSISVVSLS